MRTIGVGKRRTIGQGRAVTIGQGVEAAPVIGKYDVAVGDCPGCGYRLGAGVAITICPACGRELACGDCVTAFEDCECLCMWRCGRRVPDCGATCDEFYATASLDADEFEALWQQLWEARHG